MPKVVAIIQARMNSTRLPGKALADIHGKPVLQWMIERVQMAKNVDQIVVATTKNSPDIINWCHLNNQRLFIGDENNVLERVFTTALSFSADIIVDLTGDCPLVDPKHIDQLVHCVTHRGKDYASNIRPRMWPDGFDTQAYTRQVLTFLHEKVKDPAYRTHTGWNINNTQIDTGVFSTYNLAPKKSWHCRPEMRLTLDYAEDLQVISSVIKHFSIDLGKRYYSAEDIIDYVLQNEYILVNRECETKKPGEG